MSVYILRSQRAMWDPWGAICHRSTSCLGADQRDGSRERGLRSEGEHVRSRSLGLALTRTGGISECVSNSAPVPFHLAPGWSGSARLQPEAVWRELASTSERQAEARRHTGTGGFISSKEPQQELLAPTLCALFSPCTVYWLTFIRVVCVQDLLSYHT